MVEVEGPQQEELGIEDRAKMEEDGAAAVLGAQAAVPQEDVFLEASLVLKKVPTSLAWYFMHFKQSTTKKAADASRVYCKLCKGQKMHTGIPYSGGTSNLVNHLKGCHSKEYFEVEQGIEKKKETDKNANSIKTHFAVQQNMKWSKSSHKWKQMTMMITKWVVKDFQPVSIVQDKGFMPRDHQQLCQQSVQGGEGAGEAGAA